MMMSEKKTPVFYLYSFMIVLIVINIFLLYRYSVLKKEQAKDVERNKMYRENIKDQLFRVINMNPIALNNDIYFYQHLLKDSVPVESICNQSRMVLYIEQSDCNPCQENAIEKIKNLLDKDQYMIVIKSPSRAWIFAMEKELKGLNVYAIKEEWGIPEIFKKNPVYFSLSVFNKASNWFVPDEHNHELNKAYFEELKGDKPKRQ